MNKPNDGGPAFPDVVAGGRGMTLRMWLAGTLSLSAYDERLIRLFSEDPTPGHGIEETVQYTASLRLRNADALIAREASTRQASPLNPVHSTSSDHP